MRHAEVINEALRKMDAGENDNDSAVKRSLEKELIRIVNLAALYGLTMPEASPTYSGQIDNARGSRTGFPLPWVIQMADKESIRESMDGQKRIEGPDYYGRGSGNRTGD